MRSETAEKPQIKEKMNTQQNLQSPKTLELSRLPDNFGTGRLNDLLVIFDNIENEFPFIPQENVFPVKCESLFLITLLQGSISIKVNLHNIDIKAGQTLTMMPGCIFEGRSVSEDLRFCGMLIDKEFSETMRNSIGIKVDLTHRYYNYRVHDFSEAALEYYKQGYMLLRQELNRGNYTYKKEVIQRFCEIAVLKNLSFNENPKDLPELNKPLNRKEEIFHDFLALLEKYYTQERSISFYADRMCLTPKYLSTIIKEVSGKHGMQWIDEYVSLEAKALLRNSSLSVKQVSDQLNFPSQSMFGRFFKKMTGYSPKQYKLL